MAWEFLVLQKSSRILGLVAALAMLAPALPATAGPNLPFSVVFGNAQARKGPAGARVLQQHRIGTGTDRILTMDPHVAPPDEPTLYTEFKPEAPADRSISHVPGILRPALKLLHVLSAIRF
jgi:hypothetical protein